MKKAIVLSSGGLDSTVCVALAVENHGAENVKTISVYYGQKHDRELESARAVAAYYGVEHFEYDMRKVFSRSKCSLLKDSGEKIVHETYAEQIKTGERVSTYVPFRNGLLLSMAASIADSLFPGEEVSIYYGAHADDYANNAYADCSVEFTDAMNNAIYIGTYRKICIVAPLIQMNKADVVRMGAVRNVPFELTWSCYEGGEKHCGTCATCRDRKRAFSMNGLTDPVSYAK